MSLGDFYRRMVLPLRDSDMTVLETAEERAAVRWWVQDYLKQSRGFSFSNSMIPFLTNVALISYIAFLAAKLSLFVNIVILSMLCLCSLFSTIAFYRLSRRAALRALRQQLLSRGFPICMHCGYDLRGIDSATCPECGENVALTRGLLRPGTQGATSSDAEWPPTRTA